MLGKIVDFFKTLVGRFVLSVIYIILAILYFSLFPALKEVKLLDGLTTEFIGMLFILLVIDYYRDQEAKKQSELSESEAKKLQEQRQEEALLAYKNNLVRQARSRNNNTALDAIDLIRERGWLDGSNPSLRLLEGKNLANTDLTGANLRNAHLRGTQFTGKAKLDKADFSDALLRNAQFIGAQLSETIFIGADLVGTDFTHSYLFCCVFQNTEKREAQFIIPNAPKIVVFDSAELRGGYIEQENGNQKEIYIDLRGLRLNKASFVNSRLSMIRFDRARLQGCNFAEASLDKVYFDETDLSNAQFGNAALTFTSFRGCTLKEAIFVRYQPIDKSREQPFAAKVADSVSFERANLQGAILEYVRFEKTNFTHADMSYVKCKETIFRKAKLQGSDLTGAVLEDTSLIEIEVDGATRLPNQETLQDVWNKHDKIEYTPQETEQNFREEILIYFKDIGVRTFSASISISKIIQQDEGRTEYENYHLYIDRSEQPTTAGLLKLGKSALGDIPIEDEEF